MCFVKVMFYLVLLFYPTQVEPMMNTLVSKKFFVVCDVNGAWVSAATDTFGFLAKDEICEITT